MLAAHRLPFAGDGNVQFLLLQPAVEHGGFQGGELVLQILLNLGADFIGQLADHRAFLGGEAAHLL